jgi:hypothetical protein
MIALSKHLYIVDDLKWSFMDAILNKRIKEAIFWITEYYESGYRKESWQLLYVVYTCFYFTKNSFYENKMNNAYKKWGNDSNFKHILEVVYRFFKMGNFNFEFFGIIVSNLKHKKINKKVDNSLLKRLNLNSKHMYVSLLIDLEEKHYKNIWFWIHFDFDCVCGIIKRYYNEISFNNTRINDIKMQLLMFVYRQNEKKVKRKNFKICIRKDLLSFYYKLQTIQKCEPHKLLKRMRLYTVPTSIGCFNLERFNYELEEIRESYFYNWEYMANGSPFWRKRFESWGVEFNESGKIEFMNVDVEEKFYEKFNYEPDEQSNETHKRFLFEIKKCKYRDWVNSIKK